MAFLLSRFSFIFPHYPPPPALSQCKREALAHHSPITYEENDNGKAPMAYSSKIGEFSVKYQSFEFTAIEKQYLYWKVDVL